MIYNVFTFRKIFIKEKIIDAYVPIELFMIYDLKILEINSDISKIVNIINKLYEDLEGLKIKSINCKPIYFLFIKQYYQ